RDIFFFNNMLRAFNVAHQIHVPELQTMVNATYAFMLAMVPLPPMTLIRQFLDRAVAQVASMEDSRVAIEVCRFSGYCCYVVGDVEKGIAASQLGLELAERWNSARGMAHCSVFLALNRWTAGPCPELSLAASTALSKCEATGDATFTAVAQKTQCAALAHQGEFAAGLEMAAQALTAWEEDSCLVEPLSLRYGEAFLLYMQRDDETALARFCKLQELWIQAGLDKIHVHLYGLFAGSALMRLVQIGKHPATPASYDRIARWVHEAHGIGREVHFVHGWASVLEAQLLAAREQFPKARQAFAKAMAQMQKAHAALLECECRLNFAETLYAAALTATQHRAAMLALAGEQRQATLDLATRLGSRTLADLARRLV
ncbi:MAG: hypothetical protein ACYCW6_11175, partial [Candidatus Xenobia bacterium]